MNLSVLDRKFVGLWDTGAPVSCLGSQAAIDLLNSKSPFKRLHTMVKTADGRPQNVVGVLNTKTEFQTKELPIILFVIPSLSQDMILGVDFWKSFGLLRPSWSSSVNMSVCDLFCNEIKNQR